MATTDIATLSSTPTPGGVARAGAQSPPEDPSASFQGELMAAAGRATSPRSPGGTAAPGPARRATARDGDAGETEPQSPALVGLPGALPGELPPGPTGPGAGASSGPPPGGVPLPPWLLVTGPGRASAEPAPPPAGMQPESPLLLAEPGVMDAATQPPAEMGPSGAPALQAGGSGRALGEQLLWMVRNQTQTAEIRVSPPHLGPVEVRLSLNQDQASVSFFAHDAAVRETIEAALPRLREMLAGEGLELDQASVSERSLERRTGEEAGHGDGGGPGTDTAGADADHDVQDGPVAPVPGSGIVDHYA